MYALAENTSLQRHGNSYVSPEDMKRTGKSYNMATQKYMTLNSCLGNSTNTIAGLKIAWL